MNKLVTVVVPAYNVAGYIGETLQSVIDQDYQNIEILVVNDGSTDDTRAVIETFSSDSRVHIIDQENKGLAGARNTGLAEARGEYICIFDADDIMLSGKISKQVEFLDAHNDVGLVYTDCYHFIDGTNNVRFISQPDLAVDTYRKLLKGNFLNPNVVLFRNDVVVGNGGFDQALRSAEDWDYWLTLARNNVTFGHLPVPLTSYRVRANSLSGDGVVMYQTAIRVLEKQLDKVSSADLIGIINKGIQMRRKRLMFAYLIQGNKKAAKEIASEYPCLWIVFAIVFLIPSRVLGKLYAYVRKARFMLRSKAVL